MDLKLRGGKQVERWMGVGAEEPKPVPESKA